MATKTLTGYPIPGALSTRTVSIIQHVGPNPYAPVVVAAPSTGGDPITAATFGLKTIEALIGGISDNGQYEVVPVFTNTNTSAQAAAGGQTTVNLQWRTAATGAEAGAIDLSARTVRLTAIGT